MSEARAPTADNLPPNPSRRRVSRAGAGGRGGEKAPDRRSAGRSGAHLVSELLPSHRLLRFHCVDQAIEACDER